jgi:hypothetical protein
VLPTDEDFLSPPPLADDLELPESLLPESLLPDPLLPDPLFAPSELAEELSEDEPLDPFAGPSLAAGTLLAPFLLSVR